MKLTLLKEYLLESSKINIRLIFIFLVISCQSNPDSSNRLAFTKSDFPKPTLLNGEKYNLDFIINPAQVIIKDSFLLIAERKSNENNKIHIIEKESKELVRNVGIDGVGPGEITMGYPLLDNGLKNEFWVYDGQQLKFSKFFIADSSKLATHQVKGLDIPGYITDAWFTSSNNLITKLVDGWEKYYEFSLEMDTIASFGNWMDVLETAELPSNIKKEDLDSNLIGYIFSGKLKGNISNGIFVNAGSHVGYFDVIDLNKKEIKTIWGPDPSIPSFEIRYDRGFQMPQFDLQTLTIKYLDVFVGKNSIFLLYLGKGFKELSSNKDLNRIFEVDFNGNMLNLYQLDYPLYSFTIDEGSKIIYGLSVDENPNLVEFKY
jgi:hypothetical protein